MDMHFIFLLILGIVSMVYLGTLFFKPSIIQYILKGCLIPLIASVYITGANTIFLPIILALIFAWAGDILLVNISNLLCFRLGLASFLCGHICYIIAMFGYAMPPNYPVLAISVLVAGVAGFFLYKKVEPTKDMQIPVIVYQAVILTMALFALQLFLAQDANFGLFVLIGSICFVASDTALALVTFKKRPFYVFCMATYISAQLLIALGFSQAVIGS